MTCSEFKEMARQILTESESLAKRTTLCGYGVGRIPGNLAAYCGARNSARIAVASVDVRTSKTRDQIVFMPENDLSPGTKAGRK